MSRPRWNSGVRWLVLGILFLNLFAATAPAQLNSVLVGNGFTAPLYATFAPRASEQNNLYVIEKNGLVRTLNVNTGAKTDFFSIAANMPAGDTLRTAGEQGLLGMAFHPNYASNGYFYVNYTYGTTTSTRNTRVERFTYNFTTQTVDVASRQTVIQFAQPAAANNHNGGWMSFSPTDGYLYINTGDGATASNGQALNTLLGKTLRLDVNRAGAGYSVPAGNPFTGAGQLPEIWAYGLRNPWRSSFDRVTGDLYTADVGEGTREEVNFQAAGDGGNNYGWNLREGTVAGPGGGAIPADNVNPIHDYDFGGSQSITGGYLYRGGNIMDNGQSLDGTYFFADYVTNGIFSFRTNGTTISDFRTRTNELDPPGALTAQSIASFGEDYLGRLYMIDINGGEVFRIEGSPIPEPGTIAAVSLLAIGMLWRWKVRRAAA